MATIRPVVQLGLRYGMTLFIASEVMFFVAGSGLILMQVYIQQNKLVLLGHH